MTLKIESLTTKDLPEVRLLQPPAWADIVPAFQFYLSSKFCFPKKCTVDNKVVGIGCAIVHGRSAWLAHIIVDESQRKKGFGSAVTQALVDSLKDTPCETISLIATQLGEPVYKKIGFEKEMEYIYMKNGRTSLLDSNPVSAYREQHRNEILEMDELISGETRSWLIAPHLPSAYLVVNKKRIEGFFLPTLGDGLIIAHTAEAGIELLKFKYTGSAIAAVPAENKNALDFLMSQGYVEYARGQRMWHGKKLSWQANKVYSRIGGNLG